MNKHHGRVNLRERLQHGAANALIWVQKLLNCDVGVVRATAMVGIAFICAALF